MISPPWSPAGGAAIADQAPALSKCKTSPSMSGAADDSSRREAGVEGGEPLVAKAEASVKACTEIDFELEL